MAINSLISPQRLIRKGERRGQKFAAVCMSVCVLYVGIHPVCLISSIKSHQLFSTETRTIKFTQPAIDTLCI